MVFQHRKGAFYLFHIRLSWKNRIVGHHFFQHIPHSADCILLQTQTFHIFFVDQPQCQQNRCFFFIEIAAVSLICVQYIKIPIQCIPPQIPVQQAQVFLHSLIVP